MLGFHLILCIIMSFCAYWNNRTKGDSMTYLYNPNNGLPSSNGWQILIESFFSTFMLNSTFIPISLQVAIEIAKSFQALFMTIDYEMISAETGQACKVNTQNLNEELG